MEEEGRNKQLGKKRAPANHAKKGMLTTEEREAKSITETKPPRQERKGKTHGRARKDNWKQNTTHTIQGSLEKQRRGEKTRDK